MARSVATRLETASPRQLVIVSVVAAVCLVVALIIGSSGPPTFDSTTLNTYLCPNDSHTWNQSTCHGTQLSLPVCMLFASPSPPVFSRSRPTTISISQGATWSAQLPEVTPLNGFWSLSATPYLAEPKDKDTTLTLSSEVNLWGRKSTSDPWEKIALNDTHLDETTCSRGDQKCMPFVLVYEAFLSERYYMINVTFLDTSSKELLGDVDWVFTTYDKGFSRLQIGFRLVYLFIGLSLLGLYSWKTRQFTLEELCFEQRWLLILIASLIMLNNPFYPFEFLVHSWFFSFVGALMETIFLCALLAFLLFVLDRYRRENVGEPKLADALVKLVAIFIFGALSLSLFAWVRVRERQDPVVDDITDAQGVLILDDIVTVAFALLMVWVIALSIIALGVTHEHTTHVRRFRFLIVPSGVVTLSMLIAMFFRVYGPFNRDTMSFMFFYTMYNLYVWFLAYGFWPIRAGYAITPSFASESSPFAAFGKSAVQEREVESEEGSNF